MIKEDDKRFISVGPGPDAELIHACKLAQRGHKVVYYYYTNKQGILKRINEICEAYPIGLKIEKF